MVYHRAEDKKQWLGSCLMRKCEVIAYRMFENFKEKSCWGICNFFLLIHVTPANRHTMCSSKNIHNHPIEGQSPDGVGGGGGGGFKLKKPYIG